MIAYQKLIFANLTKENIYPTSFAKRNFSSTARKISK
jgi:hypothetical protein